MHTPGSNCDGLGCRIVGHGVQAGDLTSGGSHYASRQGVDVLHVVAMPCRPLQEVKARELRAVVAHQRLGRTVLGKGELKRARHTRGR